MKAKSALESYQFVSNQFRSNKRVFYSRFGDGDVYIMMGKGQQNHDANPLLAQELKDSFSIIDPNYLRGVSINFPKEKGMISGLKPFHTNDMMLDYILKNFSYASNTVFENPVFLHYLAVFKPDMVIKFLDEHIRPKKKMFIGSIGKENIEKLIGKVDCYIQVPARNSYATINLWWPMVLAEINKVEIIIPAAGMSTRVINKRLWQAGFQVQSFDIGSLVDAVEGKGTRRWLRFAGHRIERILMTKNHSLTNKLIYFFKDIRLQGKVLIEDLSDLFYGFRKP